MRGGFVPLRDIPAVTWPAAAGTVALVHRWVPASGWLMVHLLLLGAITHSIVVWSEYFTNTLLHVSPTPADQRRRIWRLATLNGGVLLVVTGMTGQWWWVTAAGAVLVIAAVVEHAAALVSRLRRALPSRFRGLVRYYVVAASFLPVGAGLGVVMASGLDDRAHERVVLAHASVNVLGWVGLTVVGTLVTLWPTMLRTRMAEGAERAAYRALPVLAGAVAVVAGGAVLGLTLVATLGLLGYLAGLGLVTPAFVAAARGKPPASYSTWSVLAGVVWLVGSLVALVVGMAVAPSWSAVAACLDAVIAPVAVGFAAQVLLGALSYLVPVALGGGPAAVRAAIAEIERAGALRVTVVNAGLLVCVLPVPSLVRVLCSVLVLAGLAAFLPLVIRAIRASRRVRANPGLRGADRPRRSSAGSAVAGLAAVLLAVASGVAGDPSARAVAESTTAAVAEPAPTGATTRVEVQARGMRFTPARIEVPVGHRLVIELRNTDEENVHDLVLATGARSGRLAPGESTTVDAGVIGGDVEGWCSVVGHRQMGMVLQIVAVGAPEPHAATHPGSAAPTPPGIAENPDVHASPGAGFTAHDPTLPPAEEGTVHRRTVTVQEVDREVARGVRQRLWTFDGSVPGPTLRGRVGDTFEITLVNNGSIGHSIDFHAGALAPDGPMRTIPPGESLVYRFTATRPGVWMYHCSTMPMSAHIANGMFGVVIIEPPDLPPVDRNYVLVQSELYLGPQGGTVDTDRLRAERPDAVVFNGYSDQYVHQPLRARVGERVRIWVLNAGPNRPSAFHVVGGQFDTVYIEGAYHLRPERDGGGSQSLALAPSQGGFVELTFPEPGHYPFVSHVMVDAERGARGIIEVTG